MGTQILLCALERNPSEYAVLGCVYDRKHLPPPALTENPSED